MIVITTRPNVRPLAPIFSSSGAPFTCMSTESLRLAPKNDQVALGEREIRDGSNEGDLERIRRQVGDLGSALEESGIVMGVGSEGRQVLDILELATTIVGLVYLSAADSLVYAGAIAARAEVLITGDGYLFHTVNLIHNPSGRARYEAIQRHLEGLTAGSLPVARDCNRL